MDHKDMPEEVNKENPIPSLEPEKKTDEEMDVKPEESQPENKEENADAVTMDTESTKEKQEEQKPEEPKTDVGESNKPRGIPALISDDPEKDEIEKDQGPKLLDLAFAMDCTGSMGSYIQQAQQNIRQIAEDIVSKEQADVRLALVEYRDHPPQDRSFVTRVHDFTKSVRSMKTWLDGCSASGGGDGPEAVADALHQVLKLSWRQEAAKICVFISDAPPHGLGLDSGDGFPDGCPDGLDPMEIAGKMAEKSITIYLVGCEPSINRYKEFFTALAHITGGQYVPLSKAKLLSAVITGGAQEELSLQHLMDEINAEVQQELQGAADGSVLYDELASRVHGKLKSRGLQTQQLQMNSAVLPKASVMAQEMSYCTNMADVRKKMPSSHSTYDSPKRPRSGMQPQLMQHQLMKRKSKKAPAAASSAKGAGGWFDGVKGWFGGSSSKEEMAKADSDDLSIPAAAPMPRSAPVEDVYGVTEDYIAEEQVHRLVSRSLAQNKLKSKTYAKKS